MKYIVFSFFVVAALAAPAPDKDEPVELIVHGVPEGHPLDVQDVVDIKVKEHVDGVVVANTDLLYPLSSAGIAEAIAAEEAANPSPVIVVPEAEETNPGLDLSPVIIVDSANPEPAPTPVIIGEIDSKPVPAPVNPLPIIPEPIEANPLPAPVIPLPEIPTEQEVIQAEPESIPEPVAQVPTGEVYNDGLVQIHVNAPEEATIFTTIQSWFSLVVNYISNGIQTAQQIV